MFASQNEMGADQESEAYRLHGNACCDKCRAQRRRAQKGNGGDNQEPARYEHQQTRKLHGRAFAAARVGRERQQFCEINEQRLDVQRSNGHARKDEKSAAKA